MKQEVNNQLADRRLILAVAADNLNGLANSMESDFITVSDLQQAGVIATTVEPLVAVCEFLADCGVWFGPRRYLETDRNWRQLIPYVVVRRNNPERGMEYLLYRRAGNIEEQRLANRAAIGWGGHVDLPDAIINEGTNELSVHKTVAMGAEREVMEECGVVTRCDEMEVLGLIVSGDETGSVHVGLVLVMDALGQITSKESSQLELQWMTAHEITESEAEQEGWTKIVAQELKKIA